MSEHTPGPWKRAGKDVVSADAEFICLGVGDKERARANARLIAAAPELLEACKGILSGLSVDPHLNCIMLRIERAQWDAAKTAIAQAEGGGA